MIWGEKAILCVEKISGRPTAPFFLKKKGKKQTMHADRSGTIVFSDRSDFPAPLGKLAAGCSGCRSTSILFFRSFFSGFQIPRGRGGSRKNRKKSFHFDLRAL
jgi:hypothetical protein